MKRSSSPLTAALTILMLAFMLGYAGVDSAWAAKKSKADQLKYPELNSFRLPEIQKSETANKIKLRVIKDDKLPLVDLAILFKGGSAYEPASKVSLANATTQLLRIGGTKEIKSDDLEKLLDSQGITISIYASDDAFQVTLNCLKENFDSALEILAKILQEPAFDPDKLEEIKSQLSSSISRRNDTPFSILSREFNRLVYGADSPFAAVLEYEHLDNITAADIAMMYKTFFAADNMLVGVVGPIEIQELQQLVEKHFGNWNTTARIPPFPVVKEQSFDFKVALAEKANINQTYLAVGHLGIKENLQERAKIMVLNSIFSQGMDSRLNKRVRVKMGLTYGIFGGVNSNYLYPGVTSIGTFTKTESTLDAVNAIFDEINIIRKELVSAAELATAKDYFLNSYVFNYSTPNRILNRSLKNEFYGIDDEVDKKLVEDIKKVTAQDVLKVAQDYLTPEKMLVLLVGNEEKIKEAGDLSKLGKVKELDISIKPPPLKEKIPAATPEMLTKGQGIISSLLKTTYNGFKTLKSLEVVKDSKMIMGPRTIDIGSKTTVLYPDKFRQEMSIMGGMMKMEFIVDGKKGIIKQAGQERPMPVEEIEKNQFGDLYDIFFPADKGKYSFQYLKEETIDGKIYDVIYIFDANKNWVKFFINRESGLLEIEEKVSKLPGQGGVARTVNSDFKTIKGIPFSFSAKTYVKDKLAAEETVKQVTVNPSVDVNLFKIEEKN